MMLTASRLLFLPALWCAVTLLLGFAILTEFTPRLELHVQSESILGTGTDTITKHQLALSKNVKSSWPEEEEFPTAGPSADVTAQNDTEEMEVPAPFFWNTVSWNELKARIAEANSTSLCNETQPGLLTLFNKTDQSRVTWPGQRTDHGNTSICKFDARRFTYHLPHAMQSIYACWTLWEAQRGHRIIAGPPNHKGFGLAVWNDRFLKGLLQVMSDDFNVTVTTTDQVNETELKQAVDLRIWGGEWYGSAFFMRRDDAWKWTERILRSERIERESCKDFVRIGILNRHPGYGRSILNARHILDQLLHVFGEKVQVDEVLFEDKTFREQIDWFASQDIVLTSHGAQETGLPFMPKCSAIVEIFPSSYFVPEYFSSLSDSSHVRHYMMCNDKSRDPIADTKESSKTEKSLKEAKKTNLCPATSSILDDLLTAIRDWDSCCNTLSRTVDSMGIQLH